MTTLANSDEFCNDTLSVGITPGPIKLCNIFIRSQTPTTPLVTDITGVEPGVIRLLNILVRTRSTEVGVFESTVSGSSNNLAFRWGV